MSLQRVAKRWVVVVVTALALAAASAAVRADGCGAGCAGSAGCGGGCCSQDGCCPCGPCPPPLIHCTPKPPKIKFKCVCGKPICNPCDLEGYGYNPTCWRPWTPPLNCPGTPSLPLHPTTVPVAVPHPLPGAVNAQPPPAQDGIVLPDPRKVPDDILPPPDR
jgi:hypothetical protein